MTETTIPHTWSMASLCDLGEWRGGGTPSKLVKDYWNGDIPWVSPKDMKQDSIFDSADHITENAVDDSATKLIPPDSVLCVTRSGILAHTFPVAITMVPVTVNQDIKALTPSKGIDPRYLAWVLRAQGREILETCSKDGTTVNSIESSRLYAHRVPVAPQREQLRIVAKIEELFSELDNGIESLKTGREQLRVYRQVLLNQASTGELLLARGLVAKPFGEQFRVKIEDVIAELGQGWSPRCLNHPTADDTTWGVITTTAIQHSAFNESENKELPTHLEPRPHLSIVPDDILITRAGPRKRVGVACLVRKCRPRLLLCDKAYRLRVDQTKILPAYLEMLLNCPRVLSDIERLKTGINDSGVNLTQDGFSRLMVLVPPLELQRQTLAELDAVTSPIDNFNKQIDSSLDSSEPLRQSILARAFSGKLAAQDSNDKPASVLLERIRSEKAENEDGKRKTRRKDAA